MNFLATVGRGLIEENCHFGIKGSTSSQGQVKSGHVASKVLPTGPNSDELLQISYRCVFSFHSTETAYDYIVTGICTSNTPRNPRPKRHLLVQVVMLMLCTVLYN